MVKLIETCGICENDNGNYLRNVADEGKKSILMASNRRHDGKNIIFKSE